MKKYLSYDVKNKTHLRFNNHQIFFIKTTMVEDNRIKQNIKWKQNRKKLLWFLSIVMIKDLFTSLKDNPIYSRKFLTANQSYFHSYPSPQQKRRLKWSCNKYDRDKIPPLSEPHLKYTYYITWNCPFFPLSTLAIRVPCV